MAFALKFLLVFVLTGLSDFCWTKYIEFVGKKSALLAAAWSAGIILCGVISVISYMENHWLIIAVLMGSFAGTYIAVDRTKRKDNKVNENKQNSSGSTEERFCDRRGRRRGQRKILPVVEDATR